VSASNSRQYFCDTANSAATYASRSQKIAIATGMHSGENGGYALI